MTIAQQQAARAFGAIRSRMGEVVVYQDGGTELPLIAVITRHAPDDVSGGHGLDLPSATVKIGKDQMPERPDAGVGELVMSEDGSQAPAARAIVGKVVSRLAYWEVGVA